MWPENKVLYDGFLAYYQLRVSVSGYETIKSMSRSIIAWFEQRGLPLRKATVRDALEFKKQMYEREAGKRLSGGTICNYLKMCRKLFHFMVQFEQKDSNPFTEVPYPRLKDGISRNILKEPQMRRLLNSLSRFHDGESASERLEKYRLHVAVVLLYATGIRVSEAAQLLPEDIDVRRRVVFIRNGKGGKSRIAYLTGYAADVLDYYIRYGRKTLLARGWRKNSARLFGADVGTLAPAVNRGLSKACAALKLPVITCHGFRHSLGTHLLKSGCDMRHIQMILGHQRINSTQRYTRVDRDELRNVIDRCHPRQPSTGALCHEQHAV